jgi:Uncharacterised nucleotidyltransferase
LALRQFGDLDILIAEADVIRASQLLVSQGFEPQFILTDRQQTIYAGLRNEHSFWHEDKQLCIDLHWGILPNHYSFTPAPQLLWSKIDIIEFGSQSVATLIPEHLLLFLCAHGAKHNWYKLFWICDIAELLRTHENLNWEYIDSLKDRFGTQRMLFLGLYLAHQLLDAQLPAALLVQLESDSTLAAMSMQIKERLFKLLNARGDSIKVVPTSLTWQDYFIYRQTITSRRDRVWYWIDTILTPTPLEWQIVTLPQPLFPLYYLIRLIRLTLKSIVRILKV